MLGCVFMCVCHYPAGEAKNSFTVGPGCSPQAPVS